MSVAMREAFGKKVAELGKTNDRIVVLDADVSSSTKSGLFGNEFPERFFNVGVAEANMVGVAAGLATAGLHPIVNAFSIFLALKATDQIRNVFCYNKLPLVIAGAYGGLSDSYDGASHQSITDIAIMRALPEMEVIVPCDAQMAESALEYALTQNKPVYIRLNRNAVPDVGLPFDAAQKKGVVVKEGSDVTLAANGITLSATLEAAQILEGKGIKAEVLAMPFVKPFDVQTLKASVEKTGRLVSVEEHTVVGGFGSACLEALSTEAFNYSYRAVGVEDRFTETGGYDELLVTYGISGANIAAKAEELV
ncbi:MAG: 1-deoxy-D-xylulose-5-phosphate synthase [Sphaerochaetaceae bacterium]|nr:1-deoxy-D-xylulose-5-phosphate synthase [Sphaerochaetaceae bacterium]